MTLIERLRNELHRHGCLLSGRDALDEIERLERELTEATKQAERNMWISAGIIFYGSCDVRTPAELMAKGREWIEELVAERARHAGGRES